MIIALMGLLGAAIGAVIAEYTVGWTYLTYSGFAGSIVRTRFNEEAITYVVVGLAVGIVIGCLIRLVLANKNNKNTQAYSNADEIAKLKALLDNGTITQEEFDGKKKQLLDQ